MLRADEVLEEMAKTFRRSNGKYKDNWKNTGAAMKAMFPEGITLETEDDFVRFHLLEWTIGKITRFVNTGMTDKESVHDAAVYLAMIEAFLNEMGETDWN